MYPFFSEVIYPMRTSRRLLSGLVLLALAVPAIPASAAETDKYLPNKTEGVVTINVKQMMQSSLVKDNLEALKQLLATTGDAQRVLNDVGVDPFQDIDAVVLAFETDPSRSLVLVQGKFDTAKIAAHAEKALKDASPLLKKIDKVGDYTIYEVLPPEQSETIHVAVLDGTVVVASPDKDKVIEALDKKAGKKKAELKQELQVMLAKADPSQSISIAALGLPLPGGGPAALTKITAIRGGITIGDDVKASFELSTSCADDAKSVEADLKEGVDQIKALVDLTATQNKDLKPLVDAVASIKLASEGSVVTVTGQLSKDVIDKLMPPKDD
jgi:hypothetical protein